MTIAPTVDELLAVVELQHAALVAARKELPAAHAPAYVLSHPHPQERAGVEALELVDRAAIEGYAVLARAARAGEVAGGEAA